MNACGQLGPIREENRDFVHDREGEPTRAEELLAFLAQGRLPHRTLQDCEELVGNPAAWRHDYPLI